MKEAKTVISWKVSRSIYLYTKLFMRTFIFQFCKFVTFRKFITTFNLYLKLRTKIVFYNFKISLCFHFVSVVFTFHGLSLFVFSDVLCNFSRRENSWHQINYQSLNSSNSSVNFQVFQTTTLFIPGRNYRQSYVRIWQKQIPSLRFWGAVTSQSNQEQFVSTMFIKIQYKHQ